MSALKEYEAGLETIDTGKEAPACEPERQRWFMKKARELVKEKSDALGRPLTAMVKTFGCQMNFVPVTA